MNPNLQLVSIILPAFNAGAVLIECIDSIRKQDYEKWELIIINDGSVDDTGDVCKKYAIRDQRIRLYETENRGVSSARNLGISKAQGQFIVFVDADDILTPNSIFTRLRLVDDADLGIASYDTFEKAVPTVWNSANSEIETWDTHGTIKNIICQSKMGYQGYLWNKIFKTEIIRRFNILFEPQISYNEDRLFCIKYAMHCKQTKFSDLVVYHYRQTQSGAMAAIGEMHDSKMEKYMSEYVAYDAMLNLVKPIYTDCYYLGMEDGYGRAVGLISILGNKQKKIRKALQRKMRAYTIRCLLASNSVISIKKKLIMIKHSLMGK